MIWIRRICNPFLCKKILIKLLCVLGEGSGREGGGVAGASHSGTVLYEQDLCLYIFTRPHSSVNYRVLATEVPGTSTVYR